MASKVKVDLPNLGNATLGFLIDEIGRMNAEKSRLETLIEYHKSALKPLLGNQKTGKGEKFEVAVTTVVQERIDTAKVRELLSPEQLEQVMKGVTFQQMRFTPLPEGTKT